MRFSLRFQNHTTGGQPGLSPVEPEEDHAGGRAARAHLHRALRERGPGVTEVLRTGADQLDW